MSDIAIILMIILVYGSVKLQIKFCKNKPKILGIIMPACLILLSIFVNRSLNTLISEGEKKYFLSTDIGDTAFTVIKSSYIFGSLERTKIIIFCIINILMLILLGIFIRDQITEYVRSKKIKKLEGE